LIDTEIRTKRKDAGYPRNPFCGIIEVPARRLEASSTALKTKDNFTIGQFRENF